MIGQHPKARENAAAKRREELLAQDLIATCDRCGERREGNAWALIAWQAAHREEHRPPDPAVKARKVSLRRAHERQTQVRRLILDYLREHGTAENRDVVAQHLAAAHDVKRTHVFKALMDLRKEGRVACGSGRRWRLA